MKTLTPFLAICAVALVANPIQLTAQDNSTQAKLRAALEQKMQELNAQQAQPPPAASTVTPAAPKVAAPKAVVSQPAAPKPVAPAAAAPVTAAPKQVAAPAPARPPAAAQPAKPQPAKAMTASTAAPAPTPAATAETGPAFAPVPPPASVEATGRTEAALRQRMSELNTQAATPPSDTRFKPVPGIASAEVAATPPARSKALEASSSFKPLEAPALPISAEKKAQLDDLLQRYKADLITPEEYQKQRAQILAGK